MIILPLALVALGTHSGATSAPTITGITPTYGFAPQDVAVMGTDLDQVDQIYVAGKPAQILSILPNELVILPQATDPGFMPVVATSSQGPVSPAEIEMWPTIDGSIGTGTVDLRLGNGDDGPYVLLVAFDRLNTPYKLLNPYTEYVLWLDPTLYVLRRGRFPSPDPIFMSFPYPPTCAGRELYLQAWCMQKKNATTPWTQCFTNLEVLWLL